MASTCPACGFDPSSVSPGDAIVALRTFPRRFRSLTDPSGEHDDVRRAAVLAEAGEAAEAIAALGADLRSVLVEDDPVLSTTEGVASGVRTDGDAASALDRLTAATGQVADLAGEQPASSWTRTGTRSSGPISAGDLLREAVHAGSHHLRLAERAG